MIWYIPAKRYETARLQLVAAWGLMSKDQRHRFRKSIKQTKWNSFRILKDGGAAQTETNYNRINEHIDLIRTIIGDDEPFFKRHRKHFKT